MHKYGGSDILKIGDAEKITGLTQKAIRLYEKKKLICVDRTGSDYRDYSAETVERLKKIKQFRLCGIGLPQIKLWADGIVSSDELLKKRIAEIEKESEASEDMHRMCREMLENAEISENAEVFDEFESKNAPESRGKLALGIDIGTTSIGVSLNALDTGEQAEAYSIPNGSDVKTENPHFREQDISVIADKVSKIADSLTSDFPEISVIGFTGQMHGIVYLDENGNAVSNLITWQDERGSEKTADGTAYAEKLSELSGYKVSSGYGLVTHFYNIINGLVPKNAVSFCTAMDYTAMRLCKRKTPVVHVSNSASFGIFNVKEGRFDTDAVEKSGISAGILPRTTAESEIIGYYKDIPVAAALGDNQASFIGSVSDEEKSILVNFGTGSQISFVGTEANVCSEMELRPFVGGKFLLCGSALCGGRAYAVVERFFREYVKEAFGKAESQYGVMNRLAEKECECPTVDTRFSGTRSNPLSGGGISNLTESNFTPSGIIRGTLFGMANELYEMYESAGKPPFEKLAASGNAVRKNAVFKKILEQVFSREVFVPDVKEEAASGAAKFAAECIKRH